MTLSDYMERWAPVLNWPYEVSDSGRVRRMGAVKVLTQSIASSGYYQVSLSKNNTAKSFCVHRLCLVAFCGEARGDATNCAHLNGNRLDNRLSNLLWVTPRENESHKVIHGTRPMGERHYARQHPERVVRGEIHGRSKLKNADVFRIRQLLSEGLKHREIAALFSVSVSEISHIATGRLWGHVA